MRRRSEKKSVDVSSPATTTPRRSRRSRKSPSPSESEKCVEPSEESGKVAAAAKGTTTLDGDGAKIVATEERTVTTPARRGRRRTSVKERTVSPVAEKDREEEAESAASAKIAPIAEEENGNEEPVEASGGSTAPEAAAAKDETESGTTATADADRMDTQEVNVDEHVKVSVENEQVSAIEEEDNDNEKTTEAPIEAIVESSAIDNTTTTTTATDTSQTDAKEAEDEVAARGASEERNEPASSPRRDSREAEPEAGEQQQPQKDEAPVHKTPAASKGTPPVTQEPVPSDETASANHDTHANESECVRSVRKRKWITKKTDNKAAVLAISTDSLKNLIADVQPVPLSDVKLDSSSEAEQAPSELEDGEETPSPDRRRSDDEEDRVREKADDKERERERRISLEAAAQQQQPQQKAKRQGGKQNDVASQPQNHHEKSPSPAHNVTSSILYITNLVRPFTVLQLKGLLARTGKIVEDGFWIDRIKSKCFVKYETEDEATETRHALHGVRWPVSNPKCLNVEFGLEADMQKAIDSTKEETTKTTQESQRENFIVGSGWNKERNDEDLKSKSARHVREWDVGKKENIDREKPRENEGRRSRDRDENERNGKDRKQQIRGRDPRSSSLSPVRKLKKVDEPPLRLLDDLFRKTKTTPCIYWLPLTPEQIAEKEAFRQKRMEEQKERLKQRELDKEREREKNRSDRGGGGGGGRGGDNRRNVSNDRRRSRSRDRRRY